MNQLLLMTAVCLMATAILALPTQLKERSEEETLAKRSYDFFYNCSYSNRNITDESLMCNDYCDCDYCEDEDDCHDDYGLTQVEISNAKISMDYQRHNISAETDTQDIFETIGEGVYYVCCSWWAGRYNW